MVSLDVLAHVATATLEETAEVGPYEAEPEEPHQDVEYVIEGGQVSLGNSVRTLQLIQELLHGTRCA